MDTLTALKSKRGDMILLLDNIPFLKYPIFGLTDIKSTPSPPPPHPYAPTGAGLVSQL